MYVLMMMMMMTAVRNHYFFPLYTIRSGATSHPEAPWATAPSVSVENKFVLQTPNTENEDYIHGHETRRQVLYLNSGRLPPYLQLAPYDRVPGNVLLRPFPALQPNHIARRSMRQS